MKLSQALKGRKEMMTVLALVAPTIIVMVIFLCIPFVNALQTNFYKCGGLGALERFVGLKNYAKVLADPKFVRSLWNTFHLIMVSFLAIPIGFVFVYILCVGVPGKKISNAGLFILYLMSMMVVGYMWRIIYDPTTRPVDQFLKMTGLGKYAKAWLSHSEAAPWAIAVTWIWRSQPFNMPIMYANITKTSESLLEMAQIDGTNFRQKLFYIIIPYLKPTFAVLAMLTVTNGLRLFDLIWVVTQSGPGGASGVMISYIYTKAFTSRDFGAGTAASVILILIIVVIMAVKTIVQKKRAGRAS